MIELNQAEHEQVTTRSGAIGRHHPRPWRAFGFVSKLVILVLLALSAASILLPYAGRAILSRLGVLPVDWLVNQNGSWIIGAALFAILVLFVWVKRLQLVNDRRLWYDTGCPQCFEYELVRVPRKRSNRWYSLMALPAFRYACRNCTWQGLRIARRQTRPEPWSLTNFDLAAASANNDIQGSGVGLYPAAVMTGSTEYQNGRSPGEYGAYEAADLETDEDLSTYDVVADEVEDSRAGSEVATDEPWEPFADDEDEELEEHLSPPSFVEQASATRSVEQQQLSTRATGEPANHKAQEQEDDFEWLWRRLGQDE